MSSTAISQGSRKWVTSARIEVWAWFRNEAVYRTWASVPFAARANTVTDFRWVNGYLLDDDPDGPVEAIFQFTHTCKNDGAHYSDSSRFFHATRRKAKLLETDADVAWVELISRERLSR